MNFLTTLIGKAESLADSRAGKWVSIAAIVASLVTGITNWQAAKYRHAENMLRFEKQEHLQYRLHGSNFVDKIEAEVKTVNPANERAK